MWQQFCVAGGCCCFVLYCATTWSVNELWVYKNEYEIESELSKSEQNDCREGGSPQA